MKERPNVMNMPGFTAEASLYQTSEHYHIGTNLAHVDGRSHSAAILPSGLTWVVRCVRECRVECGKDRFCLAKCLATCDPRLLL